MVKRGPGAKIHQANTRPVREAVARQLRQRLTEHALGRLDLTTTQVRAIEFLLRTSGRQEDPDRPLTHEEALAFLD